MDNRKQTSCSSSEDVEIRKGPWTMEEDLILMNYIATHGEGVWNSLAKAAGLKRTGKSCRLRWLNYLRPDVRRGNITQEEQILIMDLHAKWGNRWSKIAKNLPGRTDNEIKNFWRTRIQKQLKQGNASDNHHQHHYHKNNSGQSYDQSTGQSTSQLSSGSTHGGSHHDPYSASSYNTSTEHQPTMDTTFQLASGPGGYSVGGGQGYYFMQPPPPPSPPLPMDQEPTDQYWPHNIEAEFWPMHMGHMFNPDQGKPM